MLMSHILLDLGRLPSKSGPMKKRRGTPVLIGADECEVPLERLDLGAGTLTEDRLQALIHDHPALLPVSDIEPGFGDLVAVAREMPCAHGYIDNFYVTPKGDLVLVETKLWRNVQARREVVAQALDYVAALTRLGYEAFEAALLKSNCGSTKLASLYARVADHPEALDEAAFVDAVSDNLSRGRMLVIVLGDGIRREVEALASLLQSHAGAHFTFALVELAIWRNVATGALLAIPDTLAQTVMIERGIVVVQNGDVRVGPVPAKVAASLRAQTISDEMFYEALGQREPSLPQALKDFLALVEPLGVYPDLKAALSLKVDVADAPRPINLGFVARNGQLWTNPLTTYVPRDLAIDYNETLSALIGGTVTKLNDIVLTTNGKSAPSLSALLPAHAEAWAKAIEILLKAHAQRAAA